jgi:hypothetical protein
MIISPDTATKSYFPRLRLPVIGSVIYAPVAVYGFSVAQEKIFHKQNAFLH